MCPDLNAGHRSVAKMCQRLQRPGDRRDPWTALCALATLWADAHVDLALYHRAGYAVLASYKQALRGNTMPAPDALDELLTSYVRLHPETTAKALFEHCKGLAPVKMVVELAGSESLTYRVAPTSSGLKTVRWHAFEVRVSRIRKGLESAPSIKRTAPASTFHWPSLTQPVVVSCAV